MGRTKIRSFSGMNKSYTKKRQNLIDSGVSYLRNKYLFRTYIIYSYDVSFTQQIFSLHRNVQIQARTVSSARHVSSQFLSEQSDIGISA